MPGYTNKSRMRAKETRRFNRDNALMLQSWRIEHELNEMKRRQNMTLRPQTDGTAALKSEPIQFAQHDNRASLFMKMSRVQGDIGRVAKNGRNTHHKYDYATADDLYSAVRLAMSRQNIAIFCEIDPGTESVIENSVMTATFIMTLCCGDTGATISGKWAGQAQVNSRDDKVMSKCATAAMKYFLRTTFLIATGEDETDTSKVSNEPAHWSLERKNKRVIVTKYSNLKSDGKTQTEPELWEEIKSLLPESITAYATGKDAWAAIESAYAKQQETKPAEPKAKKQESFIRDTTEHGHPDIIPEKTDAELLADMQNQNDTILDDEEALSDDELKSLGFVPGAESQLKS